MYREGNPEPLHSDINVYVNVGSMRNQRPVFDQRLYEAVIREDAGANTEVVSLAARDPDGSDADLRYIHI